MINKLNKYCAENDSTELVNVRNFIEKNAKKFGFSEIDAGKIALAVDEACTNLMRHAFKHDKSKRFCVYVETEPNTFIVKIEDNGFSFNPLEVAEKNMEEHLHSYKRGGLGIYIIRSVMDDIVYSPSNDSHPLNSLKLIKQLI